MHKRAFGLIELMIVVIILAVLVAITLPVMADMATTYRGRAEIQNSHDVLLKTTTESLARGLRSQVVVSDSSIIGQIIERDGTLTQVAQYNLDFGSFGRTSNLATPWLRENETDLTNFGGANHTLSFNAFGTLALAPGDPAGAVILFSYGDYSASIEILPSGLIDVFHHQKGEDSWVQ